MSQKKFKKKMVELESGLEKIINIWQTIYNNSTVDWDYTKINKKKIYRECTLFRLSQIISRTKIKQIQESTEHIKDPFKS